MKPDLSTLTESDLARELAARRKERRAPAKAARPVSVKADRGRVREPLYLAFIRRQPCAARRLGNCSGPVEAAHVRYSDATTGRRNPGLQVKPSDEFTLPLCASHHRMAPNSQHSMNERAFWSMVGEEPTILMAQLRKAFYG